MADSADIRRRPRRTRFASRRSSDAPSLDGATLDATAGSPNKDLGWGLGSINIAPAPPIDHRDADERVDDLELGGSGTPLSRAFGERLGPALEYPKRTISFLLTSPGRLTLAAVVLIVAILAAGLSMAETTNTRQQQLAVVSSASEPLSHAAQNLYSALTIADASANTSFSRGNLDGASDLRQQYDDAIARAALAGARAAAGVTDVNSQAMTDIATVQRLLPVYTGLIEAARANSRQGHPVGVAYVAEASGLMRTEILPAAASLYDDTSRSVADDRAELTGLPWVPLSGLLAAVLFLLYVQWRMARRTGRLVNAGLIAATALMAFALLAVSVSTLLTWRGEGAFGAATAPVQTLTEARITAQQARAAETLDLVRRQPGDGESFYDDARGIGRMLDTAGEGDGEAAAALEGWSRGHAEMQSRLNRGDYAGAVEIATVEGALPHSSADSFRELDTALQASIAEARLELRGEIEDARRTSALLSGLVVLLSIAAAILVVVGFRHRLLEYL